MDSFKDKEDELKQFFWVINELMHSKLNEKIDNEDQLDLEDKDNFNMSYDSKNEVLLKDKAKNFEKALNYLKVNLLKSV